MTLTPILDTNLRQAVKNDVDLFKQTIPIVDQPKSRSWTLGTILQMIENNLQMELPVYQLISEFTRVFAGQNGGEQVLNCFLNLYSTLIEFEIKLDEKGVIEYAGITSYL